MYQCRFPFSAKTDWNKRKVKRKNLTKQYVISNTVMTWANLRTAGLSCHAVHWSEHIHLNVSKCGNLSQSQLCHFRPLWGIFTAHHTYGMLFEELDKITKLLASLERKNSIFLFSVCKMWLRNHDLGRFRYRLKLWKPIPSMFKPF